MEQPNQTYVRELRSLITRTQNLSDRSRNTREQELTLLKREVLTCLAVLGPKVERVYRQVADLEFRRPYRAGRFGSGMIFDENHAYERLDEMLGLLKVALRIILDAASIEPPKTTDSPPPKIGSPSATSPYSEADAKLYALIGRKELETVTNPELWKRYRRAAQEQLARRLSANAFRASVNRVRKHHDFPTSESLRRKVTSKQHPD